MIHPVLLGDSIFDNASYARRGEAVIDELRRVPEGAEATLLAQDGAVISDITAQLDRLPSSATHLFISAGGNDALRSASVLLEKAVSVAAALARIEVVRDRFAEDYARMLERIASLRLPTTLCTIYDSQMPDPVERRLSNLALGVLNDAITRAAASRRLPIIDLRVLFSDPRDYANAIEPSGHGSRKIAHAIAAIVATHDFTGPTALYAGAQSGAI